MSRDPRQAYLEADERTRFGGAVAPRTTRRAKPGAAVYLFTSAQNNTHVHAAFWDNLKAYAAARGAEILVSQFAYNKAAYGTKEVKPGADTDEADDLDKLWFDPAIEPYVFNDRLAVTRSLTFCGELNVLPTAARPLSGFENYTGRASAVVPHARQAMQSVAGFGATKFLYSTGACTLRNYIQKKAGLKAEHHHAYGALLVEVDLDGDWFARHIRATEDGSFQDLGWRVAGGKVTTKNRVEALHWGDIHVAQMDPMVREVNWGAGGVLDTLKPRYQFMHDTLDFESRNHHEVRDPHIGFDKWRTRRDGVEAELREVAAFLGESGRPECQTVVVDSNHDSALLRWLKEADFRLDPANAQFYLRAQQMVYAALAAGRSDYHLLKTLLRRFGVATAVRFLRTDESFVICQKAGGIECGLHGHLGANGARGSPRAFSKMGRRVNTGHTHSAGVIDDAFTAGTCSRLKLRYNHGPSSWSHSHIVVYPNGCRAIITQWNGKWRG